MFNFPLIRGSKLTALGKKQHIVISESFAKKCFGDEDPMGQRLNLQAKESTRAFIVSGVMADFPGNTVFSADVIVPFSNFPFFNQSPYEKPKFSWGNLRFETFILTREPLESYEEMAAKLSSLVPENLDFSYKMNVQPITDLHLCLEERGPKGTADSRGLFTFGMIALIIMLIACINFMNLNTARSSTRRLEIGVRKVLGANSKQLIFQFLGEAFLHCLFAFVVGLILVDISLPLMQRFFDLKLTLVPLVTTNGILGMIGGWIIISLLAGIYPAIFLSRLQNNQLRSTYQATGKGGRGVRKVLVVLQFSASIVLILSTLVIFRQMHYTQSKDLGYNKEHLIDITLRGAGTAINFGTLTQEFEKLPIVQSAALSSASLGQGAWLNMVNLIENPEDEKPVLVIAGEQGYTETMGFQLSTGHSFRENHITDQHAGFVVNKAFVEEFEIASPLGTEVKRNDQQGKIIGVLEDFHFNSFKSKISPLIIFVDTTRYPEETYTNLAVRLQSGNISQHLEQLEAAWTSLYPDRPFNYRFQDEILASFYKSEQRLAKLMGIFSMLAVVIASLGLLGLITFTAAQRTKEIGVRKVMGASIQDIVLLLTRSYASLMAIAFVVAVPLGAYLMNSWLEDFAYRISLEAWIFGVAGFLAALIAGLTAGIQSYKAAIINPAEALRDE